MRSFTVILLFPRLLWEDGGHKFQTFRIDDVASPRLAVEQARERAMVGYGQEFDLEPHWFEVVGCYAGSPQRFDEDDDSEVCTLIDVVVDATGGAYHGATTRIGGDVRVILLDGDGDPCWDGPKASVDVDGVFQEFDVVVQIADADRHFVEGVVREVDALAGNPAVGQVFGLPSSRSPSGPDC